MKPTLAFFDVHTLDQTYFKDQFGNDFNLIMTELGLDDQTVDQAKDAEVLSVHVTSPVTAAIMERLPKLKHVACRSTGFDHVDLAYAKEHGITVSTVPSYGDETVAEYAMMLMLAMTRKLIPGMEAVREGVTVPEKLTGRDLAGKTLGIVGTGRIGRRSAAIAKGFNMNVVAYDPYPNQQAAQEIGFQYVSLDELLGQADCVTLHAPASKETEHLLSKDAFAKMKNGVLVVNTARGALIDTPALIEALESGKVGAAGLDVLEGEEFLQTGPELQLLGEDQLDPKTKQVLAIDILSKIPNVILTNHNAFNSEEALGRIRDTTAANLRAWHAGQPQNLVGNK